MSLTITDERMVSDRTPHTAVPVDSAQPYGQWTVSWLPGRVLTRNQAITAMTLAEIVAAMQDKGETTVIDHHHRLWPQVDAFAAELGLSGPHAMTLVSGALTHVDGDATYDQYMQASRPLNERPVADQDRADNPRA